MSHFPSDTYKLGVANRDLEEEALGWVVRLTSGDVSKDDEREFAVWRGNPDNAIAFERARRLWLGLGPVLKAQEAAGWPDAGPDPLPDAPRALRLPHLPRLPRLAAIAASVAALALGGVQYARVWQYDYVSGSSVGGGVTLADGSTVTLGPDSAMSTDFSNGARHVSLARGEVFFDVRHDPAHPFVVTSERGVVQVLGTAFSVRHEDDGDVTVVVARGRVQVTSGANSAVLVPDRQLRFGPDGFGRIQAVDSNLALAWMRGRLIMENRALGDVIAELDRYDGGKILLLNEEASQRRINAVIDLQRTDSWLTALASSQGLKLTKAGPITILR
jgi:transmembrane sensor